MVAHLLDVGGVHRLEIAHVGEKDVDVDDVRQVGSDRGKHYREAVQDLSRLRLDVRTGEPTGRRIDTRRAADRDEPIHPGDVVVGADGNRRVRRRAGLDVRHRHSPFSRWTTVP
jgi:hypothetical protein